MKRYALLILVLLAGCPGQTPGGGDDMQTIDAASGNPDGQHQIDAPANVTCSLPSSIPDTGMLTAFKAQRCNVPMSQGLKKWYRLSALVPNSTNDYIQLDLWPETGGYTGAVTTGSKTIGGGDAAYNTCGVCGRGRGDKTQASDKEYFATAGTVNVTAIGAGGQTLSATLTNLTLVEVNSASHAPVASGCMATLVSAQISGTVVDVGGGGGGGGGCPATVGD